MNFRHLDDVDENLELKQWHKDAMSTNPSYISWGNHEDYMMEKGGWNAPLEFNSFSEMFKLDELNELVNFYFMVSRKSHECMECDGSGLNPATKKLDEEWFNFGNERYIQVDSRRRYNDNAWQYHLTEVEVEALAKRGRLSDLLDDRFIYFDDDTNQWMTWTGEFPNRHKIPCDAPVMPTPEAVNEWAKRGMGHDAINRWIAVEARAKHLGVYGKCEHCGGNGYIFDEDECTLSLQLWVLHPRKGCSRGVLINNIKESDLPAVYDLLRNAAERNANRFSKIPTK